MEDADTRAQEKAPTLLTSLRAAVERNKFLPSDSIAASMLLY